MLLLSVSLNVMWWVVLNRWKCHLVDYLFYLFTCFNSLISNQLHWSRSCYSICRLWKLLYLSRNINLVKSINLRCFQMITVKQSSSTYINYWKNKNTDKVQNGGYLKFTQLGISPLRYMFLFKVLLMFYKISQNSGATKFVFLVLLLRGRMINFDYRKQIIFLPKKFYPP